MTLMRVIRLTLLSACVAWAGWSFGAAKTLITYEGGKVGPGLAKSWKKGKGSYTFVLEAGADPAAVKSSLESRLGDSNGVKVTTKGKDTVVVAYTGGETEFLDGVSKARIRSGDDIQIAQESTVSQGNIRAKTTEREPADGEVKATIISTKADAVTARVVTASEKAKALGIKDGDKVEFKAMNYTGKKGDVVFFAPATKEGKIWGTTSVKAE